GFAMPKSRNAQFSFELHPNGQERLTPVFLKWLNDACQPEIDGQRRLRLTEDLRDIVGLALLCFLAGYNRNRGHLLLEGLNGVAKTALVKEFNRVVIGDELQWYYQLTDTDSMARMQGSSDATPGDVVGYDVLGVDESNKFRMIYQDGPIFHPTLVWYNDEN